MGIIERSLIVEGKNSKRVVALFDSGSSFSIISRNLVDKLKPLKVVQSRAKVELGDGSTMVLSRKVALNVKLNGRDFLFYFYVGDIPEQMVIGVDFLQEFGHTLEFKKDRIIAKSLHLKNRRGKYVL